MMSTTSVGKSVKVAIAVTLPVAIGTLHVTLVPQPAAAPAHPVNTEPAVAVAVNVIGDDATVAVQAAPQFNPPPVTVPAPLPGSDADSAAVPRAVNPQPADSGPIVAVNVEFCVPSADDWNVTLTVQLAPAASVAGHIDESTVYAVPVTATAGVGNGA